MKKILLSLFIIPLYANAQIITTIAGNGIAGYSGDGGMATAAMIAHPIEIAIDTSGNVYFAEHDNNCIRKMSAAGIISTVAGNTISGYAGDGGAATAAEISGPFGVAIDRTGNLYIGDRNNNCVRKVSNSGVISTIAGTGTGAYGGDGGPATAAQLWFPTWVLTDSLGNVYISDNQNQRIRKINNLGIISTIAGNGTMGYTGDGLPATIASLQFPGGIWKDAAGNLYIVDAGNNAIRKVSSAGIISTIAGTGTAGYSGDGAPATDAMLNEPLEVTTDPNGNTYIADNNNNRIRKIDVSGIITTYAGNGIAGYAGDGDAATSAEFNGINGMRFNASGDLLIADVFNSRIRKISSCENTITASPVNDTVLVGTSAIYSVATSMLSPVYQWQEDPGTGFVNLADVWPYSGVTTNTLTIHNASIYLNTTNYRCVVSNGLTCVDTSDEAILMIKSNTGVNNVSGQNELTIYPNPATNLLTISSTGPSIKQLTITNLIGQTVYTNEYNELKVQIDVAGLLTGVYFVRVNGTEVRNFMKE